MMFYIELRSGSGPSVYLFYNSHENHLLRTFQSYPHYWNHMPSDGEYHLEMKNREVAKGTQSALSCLCTYSTYDIHVAKAV